MTAPLLLSVFPTFAVGGAQSRFATLANRFGREWRHAIVAMDGVTAARERLDPGLDVTFPAVEVRKGDSLGNARRFRQAIRSLGPRTMLTHNFGSIEWSIANRVSLVHQLHVEDGFGPEERDRQLPRRVWLRRMFLRGRPVALPSQTLMGIAGSVWRLRARDLHYVPNGIDLARFASRAPSPWPDAAGEPVLGTVAALRPEKNIGRLIRAFGQVEAPGRLLIIGDGPDRDALEALVRERGLAGRVRFTGHLADPAAAIRGLDLFAMSSDTEQMPLSLLEAMAAGLPVAATDVGDIADMLAPEGRRFVTTLDDVALGRALQALLRDAALRAALGAANRAKAERVFSEEQMTARWAALLEGGVPAGRGEG